MPALLARLIPILLVLTAVAVAVFGGWRLYLYLTVNPRPGKWVLPIFVLIAAAIVIYSLITGQS